MSGATGNGASGYQVVESPAIAKEVRRFTTGLISPADRRRCAAAIRAIRHQLRNNPRGFGEYQYALPNARLDVYQGVIAPISVRYGVHKDRKLVFVAAYQLLS